MNTSSIWILVANDCEAVLCASEEGTSRVLRTVKHRGTTDCRATPGRRDFAWELVSELYRGAQGGYDGVVIIASEDMLKEMRRVMIPEIRKLLVGEITHEPGEVSRIRLGFTNAQAGCVPCWETMQ